jgi:hypothetical protein
MCRINFRSAQNAFGFESLPASKRLTNEFETPQTPSKGGPKWHIGNEPK